MAFRHAFICSLLFLAAFLSPAEAAAKKDILAGPFYGQVLEVHDGDTFTVRLHVWIGQDIETHVRIAGIDTPEIKGKCVKERQMAQEARAEIIHLLSDKKVSLYNIQLEKYAGRVLAEAKTANGLKISDHMINKGLARPYGGGKRAGWCS